MVQSRCPLFLFPQGLNLCLSSSEIWLLSEISYYPKINILWLVPASAALSCDSPYRDTVPRVSSGPVPTSSGSYVNCGSLSICIPYPTSSQASPSLCSFYWVMGLVCVWALQLWSLPWVYLFHHVLWNSSSYVPCPRTVQTFPLCLQLLL